MCLAVSARTAQCDGSTVLSEHGQCAAAQLGDGSESVLQVYYTQGDADKALECYEECLHIYDEVEGDTDHAVAATLNNMGRVSTRWCSLRLNCNGSCTLDGVATRLPFSATGSPSPRRKRAMAAITL